jgi:mycothiol synthase
VSDLLDLAEAADGHRPLGDHSWLDLAQGGRKGYAGLVAWEPGHDHPVAYAHVARGPRSWSVELVIDPHHRYEAMTTGPQMLAAAIDIVATEGGGHVHLWVYKPTDAHDRIAAGVGMTRGRDLYQMRVALPLDEAGQVGEPLDTRPFRPGEDEAAWLEVNNRAFDWHPEQGGWDVDTLREREGEPWFDPEGFLLHERAMPDGRARLAGFCWTKVHGDHDPPLGEIYVIAVDPDFHGLGLGRALTRAGLDHLAGKGLTVGMLYVDAANTPAVRLYEKLGFAVHHVDRAYVADVAPRATSR